MGDATEVMFTSDSSGLLWNTCIWDPRTGTSLMSYKGGNVAAPKTLCLLGNDYLLTADSAKPLLHVWPVNNAEQVPNLRFVCPGPVTALAVSNDSNYCIGAIEEKIHIWNICSGRLLAVVSRHFLPVTCLKFLDSNCHFLSGGKDGMLIAWPLAKIIALFGKSKFSQSISSGEDTRYSFSDHTLPITDLYVGKGGIRCRFLSVSLDRTCKIYDFASGQQLLSIVFAVKLSAVVMNLNETQVFVGGENGIIYEFSLISPPRMQQYHVDSTDKSYEFEEHTKKITVLSLSLSGETLLSGSDDERVIVWNITSRQPLKILTHKGAITNAFFAIAPQNLFADAIKPKIILHSFHRTIQLPEGTENNIEILNTDNNNVDSDQEMATEGLQYNFQDSTEKTKDIDILQSEIDKLKRINAELYKVALENVISTIKTAPRKNEQDLKTSELVKKKKVKGKKRHSAA